jgi:Kef-type K+ transport system membrane component KefB
MSHVMDSNTILFAFFVIFFGAALVATLALFTRQSMLVAYILVGAIVGPFGLKLISDSHTVDETAQIGIMFLLFLLGLDLPLGNLFRMLRDATVTTVVSGLSFFTLSIVVCYFFKFSWTDSVIIGLSMMFSSTIIGLKLLPTTALHHQRIGQVVVSVLLSQDILAIFVLLILGFWATSTPAPAIISSVAHLPLLGSSLSGSLGHAVTTDPTAHGNFNVWEVGKTLVGIPALLLVGYFAERHVIYPLFKKFNRIKEYVFLLSIGWCLGLSEIANLFGLSMEIGAFIAGVSLATSPIAAYIAENLKPLRDFFLIVFFFSIGAGFNFYLLPKVIFPVIIIGMAILLFKPLVYRYLLQSFEPSEKKQGWEVGFRLGQASEFSMLIAVLAYQENIIGQLAYVVIEAVTLLTFIVSSYLVVLIYPSPMAINPKLRRD